MKYATITGWKGTGEKFHATMMERTAQYARWDSESVELELFSRCENQLNNGESMDYELSKTITRSGHTEIIPFVEDDFEIEWREDK